MHRSPLDGRVYLFINRRRDRMKMLVWESGGFMLYYKRLEQGTFELPQST
jgi:transposase